MKGKKLRKEVKIIGAVLLCLILMLGVTVFRKKGSSDTAGENPSNQTNGNNTSEVVDNNEQSQEEEPQAIVIEGDGDIEIIMDDDMESDGQ